MGVVGRSAPSPRRRVEGEVRPDNGHPASTPGNCRTGLWSSRSANRLAGATRRPAMPQRHGCHQGMGAYQSPSLAAHHSQPAPAWQEALVTRSEAGGWCGRIGLGWLDSQARRPLDTGRVVRKPPAFPSDRGRAGGEPLPLCFFGAKGKGGRPPRGPEEASKKPSAWFCCDQLAITRPPTLTGA